MKEFRGDVGYMPPMLAGRWEEPVGDPAWSYEMKYDGVRVIACVDSGTIRLYSRTGRDLQGFPEIDGLGDRLKVSRAVLDGELVVLGEDGRPCFTSTMKRLRRRRPMGPEGRVYLFDALVWDANDLRDEGLQRRREILLTGVDWGGSVHYSPSVGGDMGSDLLRQADLLGFEGVMAKRRDSPYVHGRSHAWRKIRISATARAVIGGLVGHEEVSVLVGVGDGGHYRYLGRVSVPSSHGDLEELARLRRRSRRADSPFENCSAPDVDWVEPVRCCRIRYAEITPGGRLRHPVYGGLIRPPVNESVWLQLERNRALDANSTDNGVMVDFCPKRVLLDMGIGMRATRASALIDDREVPLTNLEKVLWPDVGLTKGDVIAYYRVISEGLLCYIRGRPLKVTRHPDGPSGESFFQRRIPPNSPPWLRGVEVEGRQYVVCDDVATLIWLVNSAAFEIHPLPFRHPDRGPDLLLLDLDPAVPAGLAEACRGAVLIEQLLSELGISSWVKTSGGRGVHVAVPLEAGCSEEQVTSLAHILGQFLVQARGDLFTIERSRGRRRGKVYVDYLQNRRGATVIAPYCIRPREGAPVSTPVTWDEMYRALRGELPVFSPAAVVDRFSRKGDPWKDLLAVRHPVEGILQRLRERYEGR